MANDTASLTSLTDAQLLVRVKFLAQQERQSTADLIAGLMELDLRRLYLGEGCSSLFAYCTQVLHLSEDAAYNRIRAARVAAKWPEVLELIANGSLTVTAVRLLSDALTDANHAELFVAATHKSKRDVESIVAATNPRPDVPSSVRRVSLPTTPTNAGRVPPSTIQAPVVPESPGRLLHSADATNPVSADPAGRLLQSPDSATNITHEGDRHWAPQPARVATLAPLSSETYRVQFTISKATHDKLRRVQDLMRHRNPSGDPAVIFDRALTLLLDQLEKARLGTAVRPRQYKESTRRSRHIPSAVKREVQARDGGRCAFVGAEGRCQETGLLQYHHVVPYADGGPTTTANIQLRCQAHNAYEEETWFGPLVVRETRANSPPLWRGNWKA
jgi:5-methylcytosine-specific restriction endonuclease McrA